MKHLLLSLFAMGVISAVSAQPLVLPLYSDGSVTEIADGGEWEPEIHVYLPENPNGQAVVVCPGGGYKGLSFSPEGIAVAKWLNQRGVAGIVLRYRMPRGRYSVPAEDAAAAMRMTRAHAAEWSIDTARVGIMGFSAGGHLASTALTSFTGDERPDFGVLFYPVISMQSAVAHGGSRFNLMGRTPDKEIVERFSFELHVTADTPPTLLILCSDDPAVKPRNSILFYEALVAAGVPAEMHIYPSGGHGWGFGNTVFPYYDEFKTALSRWLSEQNNRP